eukprot:CAMPEP_0197528984 /NCGR_PEP_ID=MMETSP1318-20131121/26959_1 /TAXON_ID=552666 /ORGANISM="Partenskyella glossopodia, Strain RCC365" /LENGTH=177 /DNA_ID=CAMNT_0043084293 /DNA_START=186 /DNA_END=719 /DNA_ORIENTATION=+
MLLDGSGQFLGERGEKRGRSERGRWGMGNQRGGGNKVCFDFLKGRCHRGEKCKFPHPNGGAKRTKTEACMDYSRGRCQRGDACRFIHSETLKELHEEQRPKAKKDTMCKEFMETGKCGYGLCCAYNHGETNGTTRFDKLFEEIEKDAREEKDLARLRYENRDVLPKPKHKRKKLRKN